MEGQPAGAVTTAMRRMLWVAAVLVLIDGTVLLANLNGNDANCTPMYGGFATPNPNNVNLIAYAGQPDIPWGPAT